jgi:hypothetical protein
LEWEEVGAGIRLKAAYTRCVGVCGRNHARTLHTLGSCARAHARTHSLSLSLSLSHTHTHVRARTNTHGHTHAHSLSLSLSRTHTHTNTHTHTHHTPHTPHTHTLGKSRLSGSWIHSYSDRLSFLDTAHRDVSPSSRCVPVCSQCYTPARSAAVPPFTERIEAIPPARTLYTTRARRHTHRDALARTHARTHAHDS